MGQVSVDPRVDGEEITIDIQREQFDKMCEQIFTTAVDKLVELIEPHKGEIKEILMVGGTSNIPRIKEMIIERTGIKTIVGKEPLYAVSRGAAIRGSTIVVSFTDVSPYSVSILIDHPVLGIPVPQTILKKDSPLQMRLKAKELKITQPNQKIAKIELYKNCVGTFDPKDFMAEYTCELPEGCQVGHRVQTDVEMVEDGTLKLYFTFLDLPIVEVREVELKYAKQN